MIATYFKSLSFKDNQLLSQIYLFLFLCNYPLILRAVYLVALFYHSVDSLAILWNDLILFCGTSPLKWRTPRHTSYHLIIDLCMQLPSQVPSLHQSSFISGGRQLPFQSLLILFSCTSSESELGRICLIMSSCNLPLIQRMYWLSSQSSIILSFCHCGRSDICIK